MTLQQKREFLALFFEQTDDVGALVVGQIKKALESLLSRKMARVADWMSSSPSKSKSYCFSA